MIINHEFKVTFAYSRYSIVCFNQGHTNPGCQVAQAAKHFVVATAACGCCGQNWLYVTIHVPRVLRRLVDFFFFGKSLNPVLTKMYKFMYINRSLLKMGRE